MSMTPERLAELRQFERDVGLDYPQRIELLDAVESLQAELAEERANRRACHDVALMWRKRCAEDGDIANLAMRAGLEMVTRLRLDAEIDAHDRISCMIESNERRARAELAERDRDAAIRRAEKAERAVLEQSEIHRETIAQGRLTMLAAFKERERAIRALKEKKPVKQCEHGTYGCTGKGDKHACYAGDIHLGIALEPDEAEQERAAIVAYLRETCIGAVRVGSPEAIAADIIANRIEAIERGEHRK